MRSFYVYSAIALLLLFSCGDDNKVSEYIGNYNLNVQHITGIHDIYDDEGNYLGLGIDTISNITMNIKISQLEDSDNLLIDGLITSHLNSCCDEVIGIVENNQISLSRNESDNINKDIVEGFIRFDSDSIIVDYNWDKSNIWASNAPPIYGIVDGVGVR